MSPLKNISLKTMQKLIYTAVLLYIVFCMLSFSNISIYYALLGLNLWFEKMIPSLLPFMIISGIIIRLNLTENFIEILYPLVRLIFRVSHNVCYCMLIGFLCGFPMGARTVADMYKRNKISSKEAGYLLAFVNNIGPVYFMGFVLPLLGRTLTAPYIAGMYGIPLLYGLILRYTVYKNLDRGTDNHSDTVDLIPVKAGQILVSVDDAIHAGLQNIIILGGYMILFNLFNLLPHVILGSAPILIAPLLELNGGLFLLGDRYPLYTLLAPVFGGFSCIAQTFTCIRDTDLSISDYVLHKLILTLLTAIYYLGWYIISPKNFLM